MLLERLIALTDGAQNIAALLPRTTQVTAWSAEVQRYSERRAELRSRCHTEIRQANRDTIVGKSALCLRSDLLLEIGHRRKQRDLLEETPGRTLSPTREIDAWIDAAGSVIDATDANVFTTIDMLKEAKRNLHNTYRVPMLLSLTRARASIVGSTIASLASAAADALDDTDTSALTTLVPCLEQAHAEHLAALSAAMLEAASSTHRSSITTVKHCIDLLSES